MNVDNARDEIRSRLEDLGTTAEQVAGRLLEYDCVGYIDEPGACPVAEYVAAGLPVSGIHGGVELEDHGLYHVKVDNGEVRLEPDGAGPIVRIPTTDAVATFIQRFDNGEIPELDRARR